MANKFIIQGATYNGDGTTSSEAASAGATGAWNHIDIIGGTAVGFGSIAAGDIIYIRSKTGAGANADVTYSPGAAKSIGSTAGTVTSPVTWVLDDGTTWPGYNGTLTITGTTNTHVFTFIDYNDFKSLTKHNFILENTSATPTFGQMFVKQNNTYGLKLQCPNSTTSGWYLQFAYGNHTDMYLKAGGLSATYGLVLSTTSKVVFVNPTIEITTAPAAATPVFSFNGNHAHYEIRGGRILGTGSTSSNLCVMVGSDYLSYGSSFNSIGFQVPKVMPISKAQMVSGSYISLGGLDNGDGGAIASDWGEADSRNITNNYPTLNATLADSANTPSSWRLYPRYASKVKPFEIPISKLYTATAATKTVTFHFLATTSWAGSIGLDRGTVWINVMYIDDSTGLPVMQTSRLDAGGSLTTSGLTWTPSNAWGAVSLTAYSLSLTTASSIKQDTAVTVSFMGNATSANSGDIFIFCPDVQLS